MSTVRRTVLAGAAAVGLALGAAACGDDNGTDTTTEDTLAPPAQEDTGVGTDDGLGDDGLGTEGDDGLGGEGDTGADADPDLGTDNT